MMTSIFGSSRSHRDARLYLPLVALVVSTLPIGAAAFAQERTAEIDKIFSWATPETPGCALAVSHHGQQVVNRVYGLADLENGIPISPATIFDIGSIQKQFAAAAVLLLAEEGRISLNDDVRKHFPEMPDYGHVITIDHLLTHTSGVRDWIGLSRMSSADEDVLTMILRQRGLNFAPGEEWSYSNSGYVLLKELVARKTGMSFAEFAHERLFGPLGMGSTMYAEDIRSAGENGALAYEKGDNGWEPDMMLGEDRGGGAVLSTAGDLLIWNEALTSARLGEFVTTKIQEPASLNNGRELDYARGLFLDDARGSEVVWHTGSAGAYKSMLARFPEHSLSLAMLCNAGEMAERSRASRLIVDQFVPAADAGAAGAAADTAHAGAAESASGVPDANQAAESASAPAQASAENAATEKIDLAGKAGLFFSDDAGEPLRLVVHEGRLRIPGGPPLVAVSDNLFRNLEGKLDFMSGDEFELHFLSPDKLELRSMEGKKTQYRRALPYAPTSAEMQEFSGRFTSEELRAAIEIALGDNGLTASLNGSRAFDLTPVHLDTYELGRMLLRFRRNEDGNVVALDYSNPVLRNVTFTRLSDGAGAQ